MVPGVPYLTGYRMTAQWKWPLHDINFNTYKEYGACSNTAMNIMHQDQNV